MQLYFLVWIDAWDAVLHLPEVVVSLSQPLEELKMMLLKNEKVSMFMLISPGGVGKTTLATMFCLDREIKVFRKKPNLEHIVQQLYQCEGSQLPTIRNKEIAFMCLQNFIKAKVEHPLLLVLDDVWPGSESLLQKLNEIKRPNYKILVTSRFDFPGLDCSYPFHCKVLDNESAMELFRLSLGDSSFPIDLAIKIVQQCVGVPLTIKVVAGSLRGQPIQIWEQMLYEWSKHSQRDLLFYLGSSLEYGSNKETIKERFLDLCSFLEDQRIPAAALIDM
ncbi:hypothetical protein DVH24_024447 [Malus domestica]|uniref:NB-ARC domain-containing protein n=1 Tax=Malus domestica TaxID=3750 RepID=A0A498JLS4_MALDO|nr:hypothetical protein DVH24_024447 [Malus domestica]